MNKNWLEKNTEGESGELVGWDRAKSFVNDLRTELSSFHHLITDLLCSFEIGDDGKVLPEWHYHGDSFLGYSDDEINESEWILRIIHPADFLRLRKTFKMIIAGSSVVFEGKFQAASGEFHLLRGYGKPLKDPVSGMVAGGVIGYTDITESLQNPNGKIADNILNTVFGANMVVSPTGKIIETTREAASLFGATSAETMKDLSLFSLIDPSLGERLKVLLACNISEKAEIAIDLTSGRQRWLSISILPIEKGDEGENNKFLIFKDITEERENLKMIQESEAKFRALAEHSPGVIFIRLNGQTIYVNEKCEHVLGYPREMVYRSDFRISKLLDLDNAEGKIAELERTLIEIGHAQAELPMIKGNGEKIDCLVSLQHMDFKGQRGTLGVITDISEVKKARQAVLEHKKRYWTLFDLSSDAIFIETLDGVILDCNTTAENLYGYTREELLGMNAKDLVPGSFHASLETINKEISSKSENEVRYLVESTGVRKDKTIFQTEVAIVSAEISGEQCFVVNCRDITRRKENEEARQRYESQIDQLQKLESLGLMASGLANDFNNLLTGIMGYSDLLQRDLPEGSPAREKSRKIIEASRKAGEIIQQMLAFAGNSAGKYQPIILSDLMNDMHLLVKASLNKKCSIEFDCAPDILPINLDPVQIRQAVVALVSNACDASIEGNGNIVLKVSNGNKSYNGNEPGYFGVPVVAGKHVRLEIKDNGCGIHPEDLKRIFDPFYSTKFSGRGLGLTSILGVIRNHCGAIYVETIPGEGSSFSILLPVDQKENLSGPISLVNYREAKYSAGTALVVDDEENVREVLTALLEKLGFRVLTAENGKKGLEVFKREAKNIRVVLLDISMPEMNGLEMLKQLRWLNPYIPVLICTGLNIEDKKEYEDLGVAGIVEKPFELQELEKSILKAQLKYSSAG